MPELPEVEVTRRGLARGIAGRTISAVEVREPRLRWPVTPHLHALAGRRIAAVRRRGKYLLLHCADGAILMHLGMSGSLRLIPPGTPPEKHDHLDLAFGDRVLRFRDPRRFGAVLWAPSAAGPHRLLAGLGVEPLSRRLNGPRLYTLTRGCRMPIKQFLMDGRRVVGVGNIYASESLFRAGIDPRKRTHRLSLAECSRLSRSIKWTLSVAIRAGGSSLRNYVGADGAAGRFQNRSWVYDRETLPCRRCGTAIRRIVQGQRSTYFCPRCQPSGSAPSPSSASRRADRRTSTRRRQGPRSPAPASRK